MRKTIIILSALFPLLSSAQTDDFMQIWRTSGNEDYSKLGYNLVSAGDQNLDGYDDIVAADYGDSLTYLYYGGNPMDTVPDMVFSETHLEYYKTLPLECRDLNGAGYPDIVIGGINYEVIASQCVFLFFGGPQLNDEVDMIFLPNTAGSTGAYGQYLSMGDFNGDLNCDLIVGAPSFTDWGSGRIFIYYGGATINSDPDVWRYLAE